MVLQRYFYALRTASITACCVVIFFLYGRVAFYRDPGSIFYRPARAFDRSYSLYRETEALTFLAEALKPPSYLAAASNISISQWSVGESPRICATIVTATRGSSKSTHPLRLSLSSALAGMTKVERQDLDLRVYFATTRPSSHPFWRDHMIDLADKAVWAGDFATVSDMEELDRLERERKFAHKAVLDFALALESCQSSSQAPYIALFEGDVLFAFGWLAHTISGLIYISEKAIQGSWLDLRLFNEERSIGWSSNKIFGNHIPIIIFALSATLCMLFATMRKLIGRQIIAQQTLFVLCCFTIPLTVIFFFQAGKASIIPLSDGVVRQDWGCCTQGIIVPRIQVKNLIQELRRRAGETSADIIVEDFAKQAGLGRYALQPVQLQHLGFDSVISPDRQRDHAVWSMAFEDLDPDRLRAHHAQSLTKIYGVAGT